MNQSEQQPESDASMTIDTEVSAAGEMPVSQPLFLSALRWSVVSTLVLIVVFGAIGYLVSGQPGLIGGVIGAASAGIFLALTIGSIAFANRFAGSDLFLPLFFGIVMGSWILKFIIFIVGALLLKHEPWLDSTLLFIAVIASVILSLVIDAFIVMKSRIPIIANTKL